MTFTIRDDEQARLILNALPNIGPITLNRLLERSGGSPRRLFELSDEELLATKGVGPVMVSTLRRWADLFDPELEERLMENGGICFVPNGDPHYPVLLREIHDPPIGLYQAGRPVGDAKTVAIVGSRAMTRYGEGIADELGYELARRGVCVVSGLARGIDTAAHLGALRGGGHTAAVLGCGVDLVYPAENARLFRRIQETGTILSEFPLGRRADRQSFAMRNRIVSGMSLAVVVVETDLDGGSMITARFASEQGRTLFAVPGRIDQPGSRGCHALLRDGATLYSCLDDLFEDLEHLRGMGALMRAATPKVVSRPLVAGPAGAVLARLPDGEPVAPEALALQLQLPIGEVNAHLLALELNGHVVRNLDGTYEVA